MRVIRKEEPKKIREGNLRAANYTQSLLGEARRLRVIGPDQKTEIEERIRDFAKLLSKEKDDAAVTECRKSVYYTLDCALRAMNSPDHALYRLRIWRIAELYAAGQRILRRLYYENISLLVRVRRKRSDLPNHAYAETLDTCIPNFLSRYDRKLAAHLTDLTLPYPLAKPVTVGQPQGLFSLWKYLRRLDLESAYCNRFPSEELESLYLSYCFRHGIYDFEAPVLNFFRLSLFHAVFAEYLQCGMGALTIASEDARVAQKILSSVSEGERRDILRDALKKVIDCRIPYYLAVGEELIDTALHAVRHGNLPDLLLTVG